MGFPHVLKGKLLTVTGSLLSGCIAILLISAIVSAGCLSGPADHQNLPSQAPASSAIVPTSGSTGLLVPVTITGTNFSYGVSPSIWLAKPGEADIPAQDIVVISPSRIRCVFALPTASSSTGQWDVHLQNAGGGSAQKIGVFTILDEKALPFVWNWSNENGWDGWQHTSACSDSGTRTGSCLEHGPVIVSGHGEYGSMVTYDRVSTRSSVSKTFTAPGSTRWSSVTFRGVLSPSSVPRLRWLSIDANGVNVFSANATMSPPGNGQPFTIVRSFAPANSVTIQISAGQDLTVRDTTQYTLQFDSLTLS
ncbi:hypothetical protein [Methanoregula sp.]|uniref:hypothetical protein n=1 Tax=Methanoregula sp. TaxID=2052170 RepID=UPI000CB5E825|nr:hypothetical protein [Methanoregula sp.]PKG33494.1 MAG: hypothetical protein CW742_02640 [Methanoregula sp.]